MAIVNQVGKKAKMEKIDIIKYQLLTHCFLSDITISSSELLCLSILAIEGAQELNSFCQKVCSQSIFKSAQTVRNSIARAEKNNLVIKEGKSKKKIYINPSINIQTDGNILLDYKFLAVAS